MRSCSIYPFILGVLAACGPDLPGTTTGSGGPETDPGTSGPGTSGPDTTTSGTSGGPNTSEDPGTSGDPGTSSVEPTTSDSSSGEPTQDPCHDALPAPTTCTHEGDPCGNATPIAFAPDGDLIQSALTADHVWFTATRSGCSEALYRVSKQGGDAEWVRSAVGFVDFEADDDALYILEETADSFAMKVSAWVDGAEAVIGEVKGDPGLGGSFSPKLTRTLAGVVAFQGESSLSFWHLSATGVTPLASGVEGGASIGSEPAFDGERLYFSWWDGNGPLQRKLVSVFGDSSTELADNASIRDERTIAVDATHVYFVTGDPSQVNGEQPLPMNVTRVATAGGPVTPLFPPLAVGINAVLLGDDEVYFRVGPRDIFAVPREGGEPRHVWHGLAFDRMHLDATDLYFIVRAPSDDRPLPGTSLVVRVAKSAMLP